MADRCEGLGASRAKDHTPAEEPKTSCEPTKEDLARAQQAREKSAEEARNEYFASGADEGGMSRSAASTPGPALRSEDDRRIRQINDANRTARLDPPLEDDPWGNAIVAAAAGGVTAGVRAAAGEVAFANAERAFVTEAGKGAVKRIAREGLREGAEGVRKTFDTGGDISAPAAVPPLEPNGTPAGQSNKNGTSSVAKEPNQSVEPPPLRIPELPRPIQG